MKLQVTNSSHSFLYNNHFDDFFRIWNYGSTNLVSRFFDPKYPLISSKDHNSSFWILWPAFKLFILGVLQNFLIGVEKMFPFIFSEISTGTKRVKLAILWFSAITHVYRGCQIDFRAYSGNLGPNCILSRRDLIA